MGEDELSRWVGCALLKRKEITKLKIIEENKTI